MRGGRPFLLTATGPPPQQYLIRNMAPGERFLSGGQPFFHTDYTIKRVKGPSLRIKEIFHRQALVVTSKPQSGIWVCQKAPKFLP